MDAYAIGELLGYLNAIRGVLAEVENILDKEPPADNDWIFADRTVRIVERQIMSLTRHLEGCLE